MINPLVQALENASCASSRHDPSDTGKFSVMERVIPMTPNRAWWTNRQWSETTYGAEYWREVPLYIETDEHQWADSVRAHLPWAFGKNYGLEQTTDWLAALADEAGQVPTPDTIVRLSNLPEGALKIFRY